MCRNTNPLILQILWMCHVQNLKSFDIKYFNNKQQFFSINEMHKINMNSKLIRDINKMSLLTEYINKVRALFLILDDDLFTFHIILYCLCLVSNNDNGIAEYYQGIEEVFGLLSKLQKIT